MSLSTFSGDDDLGPHILTVQSSDTEAIIWWYTGFHETQFTVLLCPVRIAIGNSLLICHTYTLVSIIEFINMIINLYIIFNFKTIFVK